MTKMKYSYVNITSTGCEGWLNLFFGEYCIAMINDVDLADEIRKVTDEKRTNRFEVG